MRKVLKISEAEYEKLNQEMDDSYWFKENYELLKQKYKRGHIVVYKQKDVAHDSRKKDLVDKMRKKFPNLNPPMYGQLGEFCIFTLPDLEVEALIKLEKS